MYFLYSLLTALAMLLLAPYYAVQGFRSGKYWHSLRERLGKLPPEIIARAAGGGIEAEASGGETFCFDYHRHGAAIGARADGICGWRVLLSVGLGRGGAS